MNKETRIGNNIKHLRTMFGETQLELALAIGLTTASAVSNWENGLREPDSEYRSKIAKHFRVLEEFLVERDLREYKIPHGLFEDEQKLRQIGLSMFQIVDEEDTINDSYYIKGLSAQKSIFKSIVTKQDAPESLWAECYESYDKSIVEHQTTASIANKLSFLVFIENAVKRIREFESPHFSTMGNIAQKYYLKSFGDVELVVEKDVEEQATLALLNEEIRECSIMLKKSPKYADLAYYYTALRYLIGNVNNDLSDELSRCIGCEMILSLVQIKNKYATNFLRDIIMIDTN